MATRGRPRIYPADMTPTKIKAAWDKKMRNADGLVPGQPKRKPCVIYLDEGARAAIRDERKAARDLGIPPVLTSKLIEDLLKAHAAAPLRDERAGIPEKTLRQHIAETKMKATEAYLRTQQHITHKDKPNIRTIRRLVEADVKRPRPTLDDLSELFRTLHGKVPDELVDELIETLRPLFTSRVNERELRAKVRRRVEGYLDELIEAHKKARTDHLAWRRILDP